MRAAASPGSVTCWVGKWGITMDDLLFYDAESSTGAFYTTNILGEIALLKEHTNWRQSWTHILPGNFGGDGHTDLLFYDPTAGEGEFWTTDGRGGIRLLRKCSIPDDHIDPRRSAFFMAKSILRDIRSGVRTC